MAFELAPTLKDAPLRLFAHDDNRVSGSGDSWRVLPDGLSGRRCAVSTPRWARRSGRRRTAPRRTPTRSVIGNVSAAPPLSRRLLPEPEDALAEFEPLLRFLDGDPSNAAGLVT